jgi:hypothetical protein
MGYRRRPRRHGGGEHAPLIAIAFGAGLILILCGALKLALLLAAALLIYLGVICR